MCLQRASTSGQCHQVSHFLSLLRNPLRASDHPSIQVQCPQLPSNAGATQVVQSAQCFTSDTTLLLKDDLRLIRLISIAMMVDRWGVSLCWQTCFDGWQVQCEFVLISIAMMVNRWGVSMCCFDGWHSTVWVCKHCYDGWQVGCDFVLIGLLWWLTGAVWVCIDKHCYDG